MSLRKNINNYKIKTPNGWESFAGVSLMGVKPVKVLTFDNGTHISGTDSHIFFNADGTEIFVKDINVGTVLQGIPNRTVVDIKDGGIEKVYDVIETESHTFYANDILSHNCKFISSDPLLFSSTYITNYVVDSKAEMDAREITWFAPLEAKKTYLLGIDPSTGTGSDYTVMVLYSFPELVQIAQFRSNTTSTPLVYNTLKHLLRTIQASGAETCYWSFENNSVGEGLISMYESDEKPVEFGDLVSESGKKRIGFTTGKNKTKFCLAFKQLFEAGKLTVKSPVVISEMKSFIRRNGTFNARLGSTDDTISAHLILVRVLEEIVQFEQDAYNVVYQHEDNFYDDEDYEDFVPDPVLFGFNEGRDIDFNQFFPDGW